MSQALILQPPAPLMETDDGSCLDRHPVAVYLARLSHGSRRTMKGSLETIAHSISNGEFNASNFPWSALRYQHTAAIRANIASHYAPNTANKMLAALRGTLQECWRLGLLSIEDYQRATDLKPIKGKSLPKGRALSGDELEALFKVCAEDERVAGRRDGAMLALLYSCGLRRSELVALDLKDYDAANEVLVIRKGKGGKDRVVYTSPARELLSAWLQVRGNHPGAIFVSINKSNRLSNKRLSDQAVMNILQDRAEQAEIAQCSPHDMRRTFISHLLDAGADISTVQQMAGHASVQTTARYDRRGDEAKRKASRLLRVG